MDGEKISKELDKLGYEYEINENYDIVILKRK